MPSDIIKQIIVACNHPEIRVNPSVRAPAATTVTRIRSDQDAGDIEKVTALKNIC